MKNIKNPDHGGNEEEERVIETEVIHEQTSKHSLDGEMVLCCADACALIGRHFLLQMGFEKVQTDIIFTKSVSSKTCLLINATRCLLCLNHRPNTRVSTAGILAVAFALISSHYVTATKP